MHSKENKDKGYFTREWMYKNDTNMHERRWRIFDINAKESAIKQEKIATKEINSRWNNKR